MHTSPEVLALLALGEEAGSAGDREHAHSCPVCSREVAELASIADVGRSTSASDALSAPSPQVWERIRAELGFEGLTSVGSPTGTATRTAPAALAPVDDTASVTELAARRDRAGAPEEAGGGRSAARRFLALAVAAALALVVGVGVGIGYERHVISPENRVIARAELAPLPSWQGATGTAEVTADGRGNRRLLVRMTTPKPVDGITQVWLMDPTTNKAVAMGTLKDGVATIDIPVGMSLFATPLVDISDEPPNDPDPTAHSGQSIMQGKLI